MTSNDTIRRVAVDFDEAALDDRVSAFLGDPELVVGEQVELFDTEGNTAPGVVREVGKRVAWIQPTSAITLAQDRVSLFGVDPSVLSPAGSSAPRWHG